MSEYCSGQNRVQGSTKGQARQWLRRQWLVTNGLGGYASSTISGSVSWRYHGLLIVALSAPQGRMLMLNHLAEYIRLPDGRLRQFGGEEPSGPEPARGAGHVVEFRLENHLPVCYRAGDGGRVDTSKLRPIYPSRTDPEHVFGQGQRRHL